MLASVIKPKETIIFNNQHMSEIIYDRCNYAAVFCACSQLANHAVSLQQQFRELPQWLDEVLSLCIDYSARVTNDFTTFTLRLQANVTTLRQFKKYRFETIKAFYSILEAGHYVHTKLSLYKEDTVAAQLQEEVNRILLAVADTTRLFNLHSQPNSV